MYKVKVIKLTDRDTASYLESEINIVLADLPSNASFVGAESDGSFLYIYYRLGEDKFIMETFPVPIVKKD